MPTRLPNRSVEAGTILRLGQLALQFARVERATFHEDGERPETDSDHTVMLGLIACEVAARSVTADGCAFDSGRVAMFALVHDLVEAYAGDTNSFAFSPDAAAEKARREASALRELRAEHAGAWKLLALIDKYEAQATPEARLVRYLDKCLPKITHALNGCAALKAMGRTLDEVVRDHREQGAALRAQYPELASLVGPLFDALCTLSEEAW